MSSRYLIVLLTYINHCVVTMDGFDNLSIRRALIPHCLSPHKGAMSFLWLFVVAALRNFEFQFWLHVTAMRHASGQLKAFTMIMVLSPLPSINLPKAESPFSSSRPDPSNPFISSYGTRSFISSSPSTFSTGESSRGSR